MQRHIDVIDASVGRVVATLGDAGITAVPAVSAVHPTSPAWANVVVGANASGKVSVWTPGPVGSGSEQDEESG
ncbi:hypothetical protein BCR44DRAFT_1444869 [Catenaria anguillulae PL171]|uniref:Uncharacterized protein n=1 Tax=Catenaria anguillulae PL171 TaxID=765915 RepID=A0A1Y2H746_9FUNG|nr:hypothetical protein BCR44DRAFT_1444869 [Catenaria anguillulae PL171]